VLHVSCSTTGCTPSLDSLGITTAAYSHLPSLNCPHPVRLCPSYAIVRHSCSSVLHDVMHQCNHRRRCSGKGPATHAGEASCKRSRVLVRRCSFKSATAFGHLILMSGRKPKKYSLGCVSPSCIKKPCSNSKWARVSALARPWSRLMLNYLQTPLTSDSARLLNTMASCGRSLAAS
jgi:hypothetical protein